MRSRRKEIFNYVSSGKKSCYIPSVGVVPDSPAHAVDSSDVREILSRYLPEEGYTVEEDLPSFEEDFEDEIWDRY